MLAMPDDYSISTAIYNDPNAGGNKTESIMAALVPNSKTANYALAGNVQIADQTIDKASRPAPAAPTKASGSAGTVTLDAPPTPVINRQVILRPVEGATTNPLAGTYRVVSGDDFTFALTPSASSAGLVPTVYTNRVIDGQPETLTAKPNADGSYTFVVRQIHKSIEIGITYEITVLTKYVRRRLCLRRASFMVLCRHAGLQIQHDGVGRKFFSRFFLLL